MRLIDADELIEHVWRDKLDSRELIAEMVNNAPTVTPQGTVTEFADRCRECGKMKRCDDAISRQAVLDLVNADWKYEGLEESINSLPPVTPQPKMGQWLSCVEEYGKPVKWVCSSCRHTKSITKNKTEYCPVCGARMGMTDKEIVDKLTELTTGSIDPLDLKDAMDLLCEIKRILSRRDRSE